MLTLHLHGTLAHFGKSFKLDAQTAAEALKAVMVQLPALRQAISHGFYKLRIGNAYLTPDNLKAGLHLPLTDTQIHLTPVIRGAKKAGVFNIVVGAVLVAASWYAGGAAGWGYLGATGYGAATMGTMIGASMIMSGVSQLLTKTPSMTATTEAEKKQSSGFNNLANMAAQGQMIPLAYGKIRCGSMIISQGMETFEA